MTEELQPTQARSRYTLAPTLLSNHFPLPSRLLRDGVPLPVRLSGADVSLALRFGTRTLLATCYDYFDGCRNWIYLLDASDRPIDALKLPDSVGFIQDVRMVTPAQVEFGYFDSPVRWHLEVHEPGYSSLRYSDLRWRRGRFLFGRRFLTLRQRA